MLGAGNKVTLDLGGPVKLLVDNDELETLIDNGGAIKADGGTVLLTSQAAANLASSVINNTGQIEANQLNTNQKGEVVLFAHGGQMNLGEHVPFVFYDHGHISANAQAVDSPEPDQSRAGWGAGTRFNQGPWTAEALVAWRTRGGAPQSVQGKDPKPRFWVNGSYKF